MAITHVTKQNFEELVLKAEKPVLVDFYAEWCGPCKMLAPLVGLIAEEHPEIEVYKVNIDEEADLALDYKVSMIPTMILFKNGDAVQKLVGVQSKDDIEQVIR